MLVRVGHRQALRGCRYASTQVAAQVAGHPHLPYVLGSAAILLRTTERIESPIDALAIVRAVERRFGRAADYQFYRDAENSNQYQFIAHFAFWDPAAYSRVPKKSTILRVKLPPINDNLMAGGIGLAEAAPYLDSQDWPDNDLAAEVDAHSVHEAPTDGSRIIAVSVDHATGRALLKRDAKRGTGFNDGRAQFSIMTNFVRWGGFAPKEPLAADVPKITRSDLWFGNATIDHVRMRNQLDVWRNLTHSEPRRAPMHPQTQQAHGAAATPERVRAAEPRHRTPSAAQLPQEPIEDAPNVHSAELSLESTPAASPNASASASPAPSSVPSESESESESSASTSPASASQPPARPSTAAKSQQQVVKTVAAVQTKPAAKPTPERRNQARSARVVTQKIKPDEPVVTTSANQPKAKGKAGAPQSQQPQRKHRKEAAPAPAPKLEERPIEVEERATGMSARLKGLLKGWL
ncbi:hypothetical protein DFH06DRAFT_1182174 [Mycena polygramma]|nr:hypothetical protein DFH06DRAFT_1182174 [Mycena polygramma]